MLPPHNVIYLFLKFSSLWQPGYSSSLKPSSGYCEKHCHHSGATLLTFSFKGKTSAYCAGNMLSTAWSPSTVPSAAQISHAQNGPSGVC